MDEFDCAEMMERNQYFADLDEEEIGQLRQQLEQAEARVAVQHEALTDLAVDLQSMADWVQHEYATRAFGDSSRVHIFNLMQEYIDKVTTGNATPPRPKWVKCSERLPTAGDADYYGRVWVCFNNEAVIMNWRVVAEHHLPPDVWMPTGLKRPNPPQAEDE